MIHRTALVIAFLFCTTALAPSVAPEARVTQETGATKDLQSDLERMHALLSQMQKNAAFVSQGYTPLKHQFELEIEMWQLLLNDMKKKVSMQGISEDCRKQMKTSSATVSRLSLDDQRLRQCRLQLQERRQ